MRKLSPSCKRDSGAALLLALWALFLLAGVVFAWALNINSRLTVSATANRVLSAEAMASSGAEVALNPTIKPASANLHKKMGNESYDVEMTGECGRFNLNLLAPGGAENPVLVAASAPVSQYKGRRSKRSRRNDGFSARLDNANQRTASLERAGGD